MGAYPYIEALQTQSWDHSRGLHRYDNPPPVATNLKHCIVNYLWQFHKLFKLQYVKTGLYACFKIRKPCIQVYDVFINYILLTMSL